MPAGFFLDGLPDGVRSLGKAARDLDFVMLFVKSRAELARGRREAVPDLLRVAQLHPVGEEGAGRLDALERDEIVEMRLDHLPAKLDADRHGLRDRRGRTRCRP